MQAGKTYLAQLNWMFGYFGMFFILVYGWDGLGYDRFLYDRDMLAGSPEWTPGAGTGGSIVGTALAAWKFLSSRVALTLYIDGVYLIPPFAALMYLWHAESDRMRGRQAGFWSHGPLWLLSYLAGVFVLSLGAAIFCAIAVNYTGALLGVGDHIARGLGQVPARTGMHVLSYLVGLPLGLAVLWFTLLKPGGIANWVLRPWCGDTPAARAEAARGQLAVD
jgi:hypothetical protein